MPVSNTRNRNRRNKLTLHICQFPPQVAPVIEAAAHAAFAAEGTAGSGEISIIMVSDAEIRRLNRRFRDVHRITDIISFRFNEEPLTGDLYISEGRSKKQARAQRHPWEHELAYLVIHGVLHLFGYTDYTPRAKATMFKKQDRIWDDVIAAMR